jgi:hypothetical protein
MPRDVDGEKFVHSPAERRGSGTALYFATRGATR